MSNIDRRPQATAHDRAHTRPLDPVSVAHGTAEVFRRLVHEVAGLVDGSLRYIRLAQRDAERTQAEVRAEYLNAAGAALDRAADLIHDAMRAPLHQMPRADAVAGRSGAQHSIHETIAHAIAVHRPLAEERQISIDVDLEDSLHAVPGAMVFPIVSNAIKNAIDASFDGARITVRARIATHDGTERLEVEVLDIGTGVSMPEEIMFAPGYTTKRTGHGLGLAIARDIAEQLGGQIRLEPRTDGPGARFNFLMPIAPEDAEGTS